MRIRTADGDVDELLGEVEQLAVTPGVDEATVVAALERVASAAEDGTETWCMAHREMARRVLPENPWRSAVLARAVLARDPEDHLAWGILGLAHSLLDNRALSVRAYRRALALAPGNVAYLHNLGHLLDALEDRPTEALPLLRRAHELARSDTDIAASFAHALARTGRLAEIITPMSARIDCVSMAMAGVGNGPVITTSMPTLVKPATSADSSI